MGDIGGKAVQSLKKGFDFLKAKTKETIDLGKLGQQQRSLEARRAECYQELGQRVVVMFDMDRFEPDSLKERVNEVHDLNRQLEELEAQMQAVRHHESMEIHETYHEQPVAPPPPRHEDSTEGQPPTESGQPTRHLHEDAAEPTRHLNPDDAP